MCGYRFRPCFALSGIDLDPSRLFGLTWMTMQGKEMERYKCDSKSIEELAENLAEHGIYPKDYEGGLVTGHLGFLEDEREEI